MNYEKLSPERFAANLKEGKYVGLTGARRAIGKTGWSDKEKDTARALADKHFGGATSTAKPKKAAKAPKVAKHAVKKAAKVAKRAAKAAPTETTTETTTETPRVKLAYTRRQPQTSATAEPTDTTNSPAYKTAQLFSDDPAVVRQYAAAKVIEVFKTAGNLTEAEQTAYDYATHEYTGNASDYASNKVNALRSPVTSATPRQPKASKAKEKAEEVTSDKDEPGATAAPAMLTTTLPTVVTAAPGPLHIPIPDDDDPLVQSLSPEERVQHERLKVAANAANAIGKITVPNQPQA